MAGFSTQGTPISKARAGSNAKHILVVDDEPAVRASLSKLLKTTYADYRVDTAASAEEALAYVERYPIDLLITDLKLPQMDGLSLTEKSQYLSPKTKSILMTAYGTNAVHCNAFQHGCVAYFEKPFDIDSLIRSVEATLVETQSTPADSLTDLLRNSTITGRDLSIAITQGSSRGSLFIRDGLIHFAEFDGLSGIGALVAMIACKRPRLVISSGAPEVSQSDLPVAWQAVIEAEQHPSVAQQFRVLRNNACELAKGQPQRSSEDIALALRAMLSDFREKNVHESLSRPANNTEEHSLLFQQTLNAEYQQRQAKLRQLVNSGVEHFRNREFDKAKRCWLSALRLDPSCEQAKRNIAVVRKLIKTSPMH